jgi:hypothetical protein
LHQQLAFRQPPHHIHRPANGKAVIAVPFNAGARTAVVGSKALEGHPLEAFVVEAWITASMFNRTSILFGVAAHDLFLIIK